MDNIITQRRDKPIKNNPKKNQTQTVWHGYRCDIGLFFPQSDHLQYYLKYISVRLFGLWQKTEFAKIQTKQTKTREREFSL